MKKGLFASLLSLVLLAAAAPAAQAGLSWNTTSYDFGNQEPGVSSAPVTFTLTATCDAEVAMTGLCMTPTDGVHSYGAVSAPGADFNVDSTDCTGTLVTLNFPGLNSCTARVGFKPSSTGPKTGLLDTANGPDVALTGTGVEKGAGKKDGSGGKSCKKKKKKGKSSASAAKKKKKKCKKKKKKK